ncbi:MAG: acyl-protein synthetase, partial [Alloprevotella sp.]
MNINDILEIAPYSLNKMQKHALLNERLHELTRKHYAQCEAYRKMMEARGLDINNLPDYEELPFLPVRLFKEFELRSCGKDEIVKTMTSSGTTGQQVSRIYLDRETSSAQQKCLTKIVSHVLGTKRVPMLILDSSAVIK